MRITECRPGERLELRGDDATDHTRRRWGALPLAFGIPLLLPFLFAHFDPETALPESFIPVWGGIAIGVLLLELWLFISTREPHAVIFDRGRGTVTIETRDIRGRVREWTSELADVRVAALEAYGGSDHRVQVDLEFERRRGLRIPTLRDEGPLELIAVILRAVALPFRILFLPLIVFGRDETVTLDIHVDGGDRAALAALAEEIGAITGHVPKLAGTARERRPSEEEVDGDPAIEAGAPVPLHSPFAALGGDPRDRGLRPIDRAPGSPVADEASIRLPAPIALKGAAAFCVFVGVGFAAPILGSEKPISTGRAFLLAVSVVMIVRAIDHVLHYAGGAMTVDPVRGRIAGGPLTRTRISFEEVERVVATECADDDPCLVVVTSGGSRAFPFPHEAGEAEWLDLTRRVAGVIGVPAERVRFPRDEAAEPSSRAGGEVEGGLAAG